MELRRRGGKDFFLIVLSAQIINFLKHLWAVTIRTSRLSPQSVVKDLEIEFSFSWPGDR